MARNSYFDLLKKLDRVYNKTSLDTIDFSLMPKTDFDYAKCVVNKLIDFTVDVGNHSSKSAEVICSNWCCSLNELQHLLEIRTGKERSESSLKVMRSRLSSHFLSIFGHDFADWFTLYNLDLNGIRQVDAQITALRYNSGGSFLQYLPPKWQEKVLEPPKGSYTTEELENELSFVKTISSISLETLSFQGDVDIDKLRYLYRVLSANLLSTTPSNAGDVSSAIDLRYALIKAPTLLKSDIIAEDTDVTEENTSKGLKDFMGIEPLSESDIVDLLKASMEYDFGSQERMSQPNDDKAVDKFVNTLGLILAPQGIVSVLNRTHPDVIRKGIDVMRKAIESANRSE